MSENYLGIMMRIITGNYYLVYHQPEKLRFIGILAYPKIINWLPIINSCNDYSRHYTWLPIIYSKDYTRVTHYP